jgi:hypothetical protein
VVTLGFVRRSFASHERSAGSRCAKCMLEIIWLFLSNNCSLFPLRLGQLCCRPDRKPRSLGPVPAPGELVQATFS